MLRGPVTRGLAADGESSATPSVDPKGGEQSAGIIRGMAVITRGEALGHRMWIDAEFLTQVADSINTDPAGVKARFTHPDLSSDGLGKFTGRVRDAVLDGDVVRADLHISPSAHQTPDGDLAGYLMKLATEDPKAFGNSIVFEHDYAAESQFLEANGAKRDEDGWLDMSGFRSPDPDNTHNYFHCRLRELRSVDQVDEPAANPTGLFHRGQEIVQEADGLASFALGLSTERPALAQLDVDPDRLSGFVARFLERHGLKIVKCEEGEENPAVCASCGADMPAGAKYCPACGEPVDVEKTKPHEEQPPAESAASGKRFVDAFGEAGALWYVEGLSFEQAQLKHADKLRAERDAAAKEAADLRAENEKLKARIANPRGETPLSFAPGDEQPKSQEYRKALNPGAALYASTLTKPATK